MDETKQLNDCPIIPLVDPNTGEELKFNGEGVFENTKTKSCFAVTDSGFVIELIDPETKGKAHLDGNFLISDVTGKKYPLDANGHIMLGPEIPQKKEKIVQSTITPKYEKVRQPETTPKYEKTVPLELTQKQVNTIQPEIVQPKKEENIQKQYNEYVKNISELLSRECGVTVEFSMNKEDTICSTKASRNKGKDIIYAKQFKNKRKFQKDVLFVLVDEFAKKCNKITIDITENSDSYNCILKNNNDNSIELFNITEGCLEQIKYEYNQTQPGFTKKKITPLEDNPLTKVEEKEEKIKFYALTISLIMLVTVSVLGVILLFG